MFYRKKYIRDAYGWRRGFFISESEVLYKIT